MKREKKELNFLKVKTDVKAGYNQIQMVPQVNAGLNAYAGDNRSIANAAPPD